MTIGDLRTTYSATLLSRRRLTHFVGRQKHRTAILSARTTSFLARRRALMAWILRMSARSKAPWALIEPRYLPLPFRDEWRRDSILV